MRRIAFALLGSTALFAISAVPQVQAQQPGQPPAAGQAAQQGITVQSMMGQPILRQNGQEIGRVNRAVRADSGQLFLVVTSGNRLVMMPADQISMQNGRYVSRMGDNQIGVLPEFRDGMAGYQAAPATERLNLAGVTGMQQGAQAGVDPSRIVVQQAAPSVQVQQAAPEILVQQAQPNVTVRQPQPEILVRQAAPVVSVEIPQPEIIVRMPQPEVNVAMAQPQVEVRQPQPQVQVVQPEQPQVQVSRAQPQVMVQPAQPQVMLQQAETQPQIRYERADPQVRVSQGQGAPNVRFEQMQPGMQDNQQAQINAQAQQRTLMDRLGSDPNATGAIGAAPNAQMRAMQVADLSSMVLYNARGERLGTVDRVIANPADNREYLIIAHGGFLGLGEQHVAIPVERVMMQGDDRLVIRGMTQADIDAMGNWRTQIQNPRDVQQINLGVMR